MTCKDFHPLIRDYIDRELSPSDAERIETHIASCPSCSARIKEERDLKLAIRSRVKSGPAPAGLANAITRGVREQLRQEKLTSHGAWRRVNYCVAGAYLALLLGLVAWFWVNTSINEKHLRVASRLSAELVDDHIRNLSAPDPSELSTSSPSEAENWFSSRLDIALIVPDFNAQNIRLKGVRRCYVLDRGVGLLFYDWNGQRLSLFAMSENGLDFMGMDPVDLAHADCATQIYKGYRVVCWKKEGILYALVSEKRHDGLIDLVTNTYQN